MGVCVTKNRQDDLVDRWLHEVERPMRRITGSPPPGRVSPLSRLMALGLGLFASTNVSRRG